MTTTDDLASTVRRMRACEAACNGISTDALESGVVDDLVRVVSMLRMWMDAGGQLPKASTLMEDSTYETFGMAIDNALAKLD